MQYGTPWNGGWEFGERVGEECRGGQAIPTCIRQDGQFRSLAFAIKAQSGPGSSGSDGAWGWGWACTYGSGYGTPVCCSVISLAVPSLPPPRLPRMESSLGTSPQFLVAHSALQRAINRLDS